MIRIALPEWVRDGVEWDRRYETVEDRMRLAVGLARENVSQGTGGPFGAVVCERDGGRLIAVGVNAVVRERNSMLHAEVMALMLAEQRAGSYTLAAPGLPAHELVTSCEPCAMCLGAILWSGVGRVVCGATRADANAVGFDEGPVFPDSYRYLERRGIEFVREVLRQDAALVLARYREQGGEVYNG